MISKNMKQARLKKQKERKKEKKRNTQNMLIALGYTDSKTCMFSRFTYEKQPSYYVS